MTSATTGLKQNQSGNMFSLPSVSRSSLPSPSCKRLKTLNGASKMNSFSATEASMMIPTHRPASPCTRSSGRVEAIPVGACGEWIRKQLSTEMWKHVVSSAGTAAAYLITMTLCVAIATAFTLLRFYFRLYRRRIAQEQRAMQRIQWVRQRVQRAAVLGQAAEKWIRPEDYLIAARMLYLHNTFLQHTLSLAEAASHAARTPRLNARHVLSVCFRRSTVDNWRMKATGDALYNTVHGGDLGVCEVGWDALMEVPEIERESTKTGHSGSTSSYRTSCVPPHIEERISSEQIQEQKRAVPA